MEASGNPVLVPDEGIDLPFDPETDQFWFFVVEAEVKGCSAEFYLNDIPLSLNTPDEGWYLAQPVNQYIIDGRNELAFIVKPGRYPSTVLTGDKEEKDKDEASPGGLQSVKMRLCRYPFGALVGGADQEVLQSLEWPQKIHEEEHEYPLRMSLAFERTTGTGPWSWEALPKLTLDDKTRAGVLTFLETLRSSLEARDPSVFLEAAAPRFDDLAAAYEDPPYKKRNAFRRIVDEITGIEPLNPESFDLRLAANGRLIQCIAKDWASVLRSAPDADGNVDEYDLLLGLSDGKWQIYR